MGRNGSGGGWEITVKLAQWSSKTKVILRNKENSGIQTALVGDPKRWRHGSGCGNRWNCQI